ncbi:hypothetical protein BRC81_02590 [Halobacteriales archaeon QS_1_68_20]|nr:MAG: hypothetical protein BRC81_02590 [Halobacteriales archaeon QS_1_68_20]
MFDRRGVSESLGFVFVFGIIVSMTAVVYVTAFDDLQETRDFEQGNNAQRAFDVLKANVEDVSQRGAPSRGTEVKLSDAQLYAGDDVRINVTVFESGNQSNNASFTPNVQPIVYETEDSAIVYTNGAVFRRSPGGTVMVQEPEFVLDDERVVIPLVHTYVSGDVSSVGGDRTVLVRTLNDHPDGLPDVMDVPDVSEYNVTISMTTPRAEAWVDYFESEDLDCNRSGDDLQCWNDDVDRVQVTRTLVKVVFE